MPRGACSFKQQDVTRALKAAVAAGISVQRIEICRDGKICIVTSQAQHEAEPESPNTSREIIVL